MCQENETSNYLVKQLSRRVLRKRCSENMQQIYRRTPVQSEATLLKWRSVAKRLYWNCTSAWVFSSKFAAYFQNIYLCLYLFLTYSCSVLGSRLCKFRFSLVEKRPYFKECFLKHILTLYDLQNTFLVRYTR